MSNSYLQSFGPLALLGSFGPVLSSLPLILGLFKMSRVDGLQCRGTGGIQPVLLHLRVKERCRHLLTIFAIDCEIYSLPMFVDGAAKKCATQKTEVQRATLLGIASSFSPRPGKNNSFSRLCFAPFVFMCTPTIESADTTGLRVMSNTLPEKQSTAIHVAKRQTRTIANPDQSIPVHLHPEAQKLMTLLARTCVAISVFPFGMKRSPSSPLGYWSFSSKIILFRSSSHTGNPSCWYLLVVSLRSA